MAEVRTAPSTAMTVDWLAQERIRRIVLLLCVLAVPHMLWMPIWASALFLLAVAWRLAAARTGGTLEPAWLRHALTLGGCAGVYLQFGSLNGQQPGVTLLVIMAGMKLLETRSLRDCRLLLYLGVLMLLGQLLYSQDLPWLIGLGLGLIGIVMVLIDLQHPQEVLPARVNLRLAARLAAKALPIALLFFVLFPRIPGPLWGLPADSSAGRTGLSDSMSPGDISSLAQSDEVAFRVRFTGEPPPNAELYWRGPVLVTFDGTRWTPRERLPSLKLDALLPHPDALAYEIQLEAHGRDYLPALERVTQPLPSDATMVFDYTLSSSSPVLDARLLRLQSLPENHPAARLDAQVDPRRLFAYRQLPRDRNPQTRDLARRWFNESNNPETYIRRVLQHFRVEAFRYTLNPGLLTRPDRIDEFLFTQRAGFCEHYAASFVVLMRAAGIPARVVTGYQGAERNGDYYIVRQSDAHAWAEVWLEGVGWRRIDPTAAVAPERIELGLGGALDDASLSSLARGRNRDGQWLPYLQLRWDRIDAFWNRAILAYGPELQKQFLSRFGMGDLRSMLFGLVIVLAGSGLILALWLFWQHRPRRAEDPLADFRAQLLRRAGVPVDPSRQGPLQLRDALDAAGVLDAEMKRILGHYQRLRYARDSVPEVEQVRSLTQALRRWTPVRKSASMTSASSRPSGEG